MTTSIRTISVLTVAIFTSLSVTQADASRLQFRDMEQPDILDNFELDSDGDAALDGRAADEGTQHVAWNADEDFRVVDNGGDGFVERLSNNAGNLIAYLPYMYDTSRTDVNSVFAEVSLPDYTLDGRSDSISLGFVNDQTADSFSSGDSSPGASDLWMELSRDGDTNTALATVYYRLGQHNQQLGSTLSLDFTPDAPLELELAYDPASNNVAARVDSTSVFDGGELGDDPTDTSTWTAQLPENWQIAMTGYGFEMDSGIGSAVYSFEAVPEPSSLLLTSLALMASGLVLQRRRNG